MKERNNFIINSFLTIYDTVLTKEIGQKCSTLLVLPSLNKGIILAILNDSGNSVSFMDNVIKMSRNNQYIEQPIQEEQAKFHQFQLLKKFFCQTRIFKVPISPTVNSKWGTVDTFTLIFLSQEELYRTH